MTNPVLQTLRSGVAIPAMPLALTAQRKLDERRQRALARYYIAAGVGGIAAGVHTTQFAIRDPKIGLFKPVLQITAEEFARADASTPSPGTPGEASGIGDRPRAGRSEGSRPARTNPLLRIGGICGA